MKYVLPCVVLFLFTTALAQQQGQRPPTANPPYQTPPTFPQGPQTPRGHMPPDTQAPPPQAISNERVEGQIVNQLKTEPALSGTNVDVRVDENSVVVTGTVDTTTQHDLALGIAQSNAGDRNVLDRIMVKGRT